MTTENLAFCVIGASGSGKSMFGEILHDDFNYDVLSLSSGVREAARREHLVNPTREQLQLLANAYRAERGYDVFARIVAESPEFLNSSRLVLEGARHPAEITYMQQSFGGIMRVVGIVASLDKRFDRVMHRKGKADAIDFATFKRNDERENGGTGTDFGQNNARCFELADVMIENEGDTREEFKSALLAQLGNLL